MAEILVLLEGYSKEIDSRVKSVGSVTLIKANNKNVIVDTANPSDSKLLVKLLKENGLKTEDINYVINTHLDIDHVGCNSLFENAIFIGYKYILQRDEFRFFDDEYVVDADVKVITTLGHSYTDISVVVKTDNGVVIIAGDIFENENDCDGEQARKWSIDWELQCKSRRRIFEIADFIIPGHGKMFKVNKKDLLNLKS